jgi:hypothetical protein
MALMKDLRTQLQDHLDANQIKNGQNVERLIDTSSEKTIESSKQLISSSLIHAADISTSIRSFDISQTWADKLFEEFFDQGDAEKSKGLEISFLCDRKTTEIAGGQAGFIQFVVIPIFKQLSDLSPAIEKLQIKSASSNINSFNELAKSLASKKNA